MLSLRVESRSIDNGAFNRWRWLAPFSPMRRQIGILNGLAPVSQFSVAIQYYVGTLQRAQRAQIVIGTKPGMLTGAVVDGAKHPPINTTVVLLPDGAARRRAEAFHVVTTDTAGRFQIPLILAGSYTLFVWEAVETGAWQDPDFLKEFEARGTRIQKITDGARESISASVIAAQ